MELSEKNNLQTINFGELILQSLTGKAPLISKYTHMHMWTYTDTICICMDFKTWFIRKELKQLSSGKSNNLKNTKLISITIWEVYKATEQ